MSRCACPARSPLALLLLLVRRRLRGAGRSRPLAIEDYYRVLTITNPQIAPDGKTVRFSVTTRVESDNSTKTETFTVPTDGSAPPSKVAAAPAGGAVDAVAGVAAARVTSPDGKWHGADAGEAAAEGRTEIRQRLREAPPGALQGRDVRLEGLPARRRARSPRRIPPRRPRCRSCCSRPARAAPKTLVDMDMRPGEPDVASRTAS